MLISNFLIFVLKNLLMTLLNVLDTYLLFLSVCQHLDKVDFLLMGEQCR